MKTVIKNAKSTPAPKSTKATPSAKKAKAKKEVTKATTISPVEATRLKVTPSEAITGKNRSRTPGDFLIIPQIKTNPCNPLKARYGLYQIWLATKKPLSVEEYMKKGGVMFDLLDAVKLGRAKIVAPEPIA